MGGIDDDRAKWVVTYLYQYYPRERAAGDIKNCIESDKLFLMTFQVGDAYTFVR